MFGIILALSCMIGLTNSSLGGCCCGCGTPQPIFCGCSITIPLPSIQLPCLPPLPPLPCPPPLPCFSLPCLRPLPCPVLQCPICESCAIPEPCPCAQPPVCAPEPFVPECGGGGGCGGFGYSNPGYGFGGPQIAPPTRYLIQNTNGGLQQASSYSGSSDLNEPYAAQPSGSYYDSDLNSPTDDLAPPQQNEQFPEEQYTEQPDTFAQNAKDAGLQRQARGVKTKTDSKCNNEKIKKLILKNIVANDPVSSKRAIHKAALREISGSILDVICSNAGFTYIVSTSEHCEAQRDQVICFAYKRS